MRLDKGRAIFPDENGNGRAVARSDFFERMTTLVAPGDSWTLWALIAAGHRALDLA